jgi:hypothetical protein
LGCVPQSNDNYCLCKGASAQPYLERWHHLALGVWDGGVGAHLHDAVKVPGVHVLLWAQCHEQPSGTDKHTEIAPPKAVPRVLRPDLPPPVPAGHATTHPLAIQQPPVPQWNPDWEYENHAGREGNHFFVPVAAAVHPKVRHQVPRAVVEPLTPGVAGGRGRGINQA